MIANAKNVELTETFIGAFSDVFRAQSNIWDGALSLNSWRHKIIFTKSSILDIWMVYKRMGSSFRKVKDFVIFLNTQLLFHHFKLNV